MADTPLPIEARLRNYKPLVATPYMNIILEVPAERATEVIRALGYPSPSNQIRVAVIRLVDEIAEQNKAASESSGQDMERAKAGEVKTVLLNKEERPASTGEGLPAYLHNVPEEA